MECTLHTHSNKNSNQNKRQNINNGGSFLVFKQSHSEPKEIYCAYKKEIVQVTKEESS